MNDASQQVSNPADVQNSALAGIRLLDFGENDD
jgi:hypothetical protein